MNILYLINYAGKGGSEKYIFSMAQYCLSKKDKLFFAYNEKGLLTEQMESLGAEIFPITMKSPVDISAAYTLAKISAKNKIDIIHTQFARENYIAVLSKRLFGNTAKIIHTCHINTENNILWKILNKFHMGENYAVIAVCNSVKEKLIENNYPAGKIRLIFNGVKFRENIEKDYSLHNEFNIEKNSFIFISLTRFSEEKGILFLIESAELLEKKHIPFALIIAGDGPLYKEAAQYISEKSLDNIIYLPGYRSDSDRLLRGADCFINSSSSEALSFAILEAMEGGLPIIATNVGGNPDIINSKTCCGYKVDYGDTIGLSMAMKDILQNPATVEEMSKASRLAIKNIFNLDNSIIRTYNIYAEALTYDNRR